MWIRQAVLMEAVQARAQQQGMAEALERQNVVLQTNLDWARFRITQLEKERAALTYHYMGVSLPTPELVHAPMAAESIHPLNQLSGFEGMSDAEADLAGITHGPDGSVVYMK